MYVIVAEFTVKPDQAGGFAQIIERQAKDSLDLEEGCHQFDVCQAENDPGKFLLYEVYSDKAAFDKHRGLSHTAKFVKAVEPMVIDRAIRSFSRR